jgi:hypothetical protein
MLSVIPSEISQESNASDPVDWIVEVDSSTEADEPDEVDVTKTIISTSEDIGTFSTVNGTRITYVDNRDCNTGRNAVVHPYLMAAQQKSGTTHNVDGILTNNLAGWRLASLRIDKNEVNRLLSDIQSHLENRDHCSETEFTSTRWEKAGCENIPSQAIKNTSFVYRPTVMIKCMRKCLGSFYLCKIARSPTRKKRVCGYNQKHMKIDNIGEDLARNLVVEALSPTLLPPSEIEQIANDVLPIETT